MIENVSMVRVKENMTVRKIQYSVCQKALQLDMKLVCFTHFINNDIHLRVFMT